jgi:hypothetical protein
VFWFREVSTRVEWRGGSSVGFWVGDVPAHGSLVMVVREGERGEAGREEGSEQGTEWAELKWTE